MALLCSALAWQRNETATSEREFAAAIADLSVRGLVDNQKPSLVTKREPQKAAPGPVTPSPLAGLPAEEQSIYRTDAGFLAVAAAIAEAEVDGGLSQMESCEVASKVLRGIFDVGKVSPSVEESRTRIHTAAAVRLQRRGGPKAETIALNGNGNAKGEPTVAGASSHSGKAEHVLVESARLNVVGGEVPAEQRQTGKRGPGTANGGDDDDFVEAKKPRDVSWQNKFGAKTGSKRGDVALEEMPENANLPTQLQGLDPYRAGGFLEDFRGSLENADDFPHQRRPGRVFYSSRTHAQLTQVIRELKTSGYTPRMTMLASRNEYCLNMVARHGNDTNETCDKLLQDNACAWYKDREVVAGAMRTRVEPFDIEDMNRVGEEIGGCTYFAAVELAKDAELILCPYNYLLDANIRRTREIDVTGDIVIFDEAHNIEDHARETASFTQEHASFRMGVEEIQELTAMSRIGLPQSELAMSYLAVQELMASAASLCDLMLASDRLHQEANAEVATYERHEVIECLEKVRLTRENVIRYQKALAFVMNSRDEDYDYKSEAAFGEDTMDAGAVFFNRSEKGKGSRGRKIRNGDDEAKSRRVRGRGRPGCKCLRPALALCTPLMYALEHPDSFILALQRVANNWEQKTELNLWCLNAAVPFEALSKARSIIVTSGTLTPLESFAGELNINFSIAKSLPHVVNVQKQVYTSVVASGPGLVRMDTTYRNTSNFQFQDSLGVAILDYCKIIPGGVLIFFPSYRLMNLLVQRWRSNGCWEQLEHIKGLVVCESSKRGREFKEVITSYNIAANKPDGAVMLGVCRGKISEGLDFKDAAARGVLIIGIPYPSFLCPQLTRKRAWNDRERKVNERLELPSGSAWYDMQAFRALNQAVGRCVRHRKDYGAIVLLDQRFRSATVAKQLPGWVRGAMRPNAPATHEATLHGLTTFFANVEANLPT